MAVKKSTLAGNLSPREETGVDSAEQWIDSYLTAAYDGSTPVTLDFERISAQVGIPLTPRMAREIQERYEHPSAEWVVTLDLAARLLTFS